MGRRSPDSPDVAEYHDKIDKYRDSRHRSPSMSEKRRYEKSYSPVPIKSRRPRRSRSYESPDRRRGRKHVRRIETLLKTFTNTSVTYFSNTKTHHLRDALVSSA